MDALHRLKEKLKNCEKIYAGMINELTTEASAASCVGKYDFMFIDFEHGNLCPELGRPFFKICREIDLPTIARVQDCEYHCISKCIDMGADGVMIPRTETLEQVKLAIESVRFYPRGRKGVGGAGLFRKGEKFEEINDNRLIILQIESPLGVANLDEMLTRYGEEIAAAVVGPCDMANTCGCGIDIAAPIVLENAQRVVDICRRHGKPAGIFCTPGNLAYYYNTGMRILWYGNDAAFHLGGEEAMQRQKADMDRMCP